MFRLGYALGFFDVEEIEGYRGQRLGLPKSGPRSIPGLGLRVLALFLDWSIAYFLARLVVSATWGEWNPDFAIAQLIAFFVQVSLFTWLLGGSMGQRLLRIRVMALPAGGSLSLPRTLARTVLILLVLPAAVYDRDGRGLHDRVGRSVVVRG